MLRAPHSPDPPRRGPFAGRETRGSELRIVAFAYACEPGRGSEPTAGWLWAQMLARLGETWVITRANNRATIESELKIEGPLHNVHFVYVDLPQCVRRWKRGQRGVRLYYLLWQQAALREARRLEREHSFDLAWHLTFANAWIGSTACLLGVPFVYGPVGGGVAPPWRLAGVLGTRGTLYELLRAIVRASGRYLNPLARASWRRATLILVQNRETGRWLPSCYQSKATVFPNAILDYRPTVLRERPARVMLFAGRLLPWKGVSIAIYALQSLPGWRLIVCGEGPDSARLRRLAKKLGVESRIDFRNWIEHSELPRVMREEASVLVFPSLHDDAGWVVVEAMASGLPVVCLDRGGPPALAGPAGAVVSSSGGARTVADALASVLRAKAFPSVGKALDRAREFELPERVGELRRELERVGLLDTMDGQASNGFPQSKPLPGKAGRERD